ncbi:permease-like cell division protein FtsX [Dactylosporangium sp. NPDC000555]|uniref:permease-like cell division protein FtsX n=1 Tax=Dactylosporangium sp. NPDC000555 TaxID=3154260 RepID=UPI0033334094
MTQPVPDPAVSPSLVADITTSPPAPAAQPRQRGLLLLILVAALVLLAVAGAGFVGGFLFGRPAAEKYTVWVYLKTDANDSDKVEVRKALERLHPDNAIRFVTKEQAEAKAKETFHDYPDALKYMTAENLPESFEADLVTRSITCKDISPIWKMEGVEKVTVGRKYHDDVPGATIGC